MKIALNEFIPLDELYWNEDENRYQSIGGKDLIKLLQNSEMVLDDEQKVDNLVKWATAARTNYLLLKGVLENRLEVSDVNDEHNISFRRKS